MRITFLIVSSLIFTVAVLKAQNTELEGTVRIIDGTPKLELFDSGIGENRLEGIIEENVNDIYLRSLIDDIFLTAADDIFFQGDSITFGRSSITRSDFTFHHEFGSVASNGLSIENNESNNERWNFYVSNDSGTLLLGRNGSFVGSFATNCVYTASDRRLKKNIEPLDSVLEGLMTLTPKTYEYIESNRTNHKSIGFIAQEVKKYFPELVLDDPMDDGEVILQVNYAGFGVLAVKAIQEQQDLISSQQLMINTQEKRIEKQDQIIESMQSQMNHLLTRISKLENQ